ncbi:PAS domain-containing protein [Roseateles toxinivorans]|uniref:histidine kinase n=1 Tax=Roseateles toxinivorans TaxID=270368 RepID=A0A4R6QRD2_9BURK|nr:PAS domain-containing protein [Roseateles toxinivorans]TDP72755.1 PAS domain S-box-containing protein [Roseateles toxinivorans]
MSSSERADLTLAAAGLQALMGCDLPMGLAVLDRHLRYVQINELLARANGLGVAEHLGRSVREVLPKAADQLVPLLQAVLDSGQGRANFRVAAEVPSVPGEVSDWQASYMPIKDAEGRVIGVLVQAVNHSLEGQARLIREEGEQRLRRVLDSLFVFVGVLSPEGVLQEANRAPLEAGGVSLEEVRGKPFWDTYWWSHDPDLQDWLRQSAQRAVALGETLRRDVEVRMAGDSRMAVDFMLAPLHDAEGRTTHLIASGIDINTRRASERALRDSEDRYRRVFEGSTMGKCLVGSDGAILVANPSMAMMFGYSAEEMVGMTVHELVPQRQRSGHVGLVRQFLRQPQRRLMAQRQELFALRRDGSEFPVEIALNPLREGNDQQVLATISDVTDRRAAQMEIERALREKTVLLNEVHHRVKNNLQIISSLLNLQARNAEPGVKVALQDSQSRVRAMALMHQLLYERADFSALELGPYIRRLGGLLRDTYLGAGSTVRLQIVAPDAGLRIDLQRAIPCGLLVNELVTNSIKHAFPGGVAGQIVVELTDDGSGQVQLDVGDDGAGLSEGVEPGQGGGLGFQLLPVLAEQCRAKLELLDSGGRRGTHWRLLLQINRAC